MSERDFWVEVHRGLGHVLRGVGAISAAIARRHMDDRDTRVVADMWRTYGPLGKGE